MYCLEECKEKRMKEKPLELKDWMRMYGCDIGAINETGLNGDE